MRCRHRQHRVLIVLKVLGALAYLKLGISLALPHRRHTKRTVPSGHNISTKHPPELLVSTRMASKEGLRIALLGGSLSGLTAVKELLKGLSGRKQSQVLTIDVFRGIYDPVEPNWQYGRASKPYVDYVPEVFRARGEDFAHNLRDWVDAGLVAPVEKGAVVDAGPETPSVDEAAAYYAPVGGAMKLCVSLGDKLKNYESEFAKVRLRKEWVWSMTSAKDTGKGWTLLLGTRMAAELQEQYDFVMLSYDFCYRMHHVKSFRELLDGARPATDGLIGCFGQLHAAKCVAASFSVEPPLGDQVSWSAATVKSSDKLQWICRPQEVETAKWRRRKGAEHWQILSKSAFSKARFGPGWKKDAAFKELLTELERILNVDLSKHRVELASPCYHWDLPAPLNRPAGQHGLLADGPQRIAWAGDFCVEPTAEGCWLAGVRAGQVLTKVFGARDGPDFGQLGPDLLPRWEYHSRRCGDVDLASLALDAEPEDSAYRGTCNWEAAEGILQRELDRGLLEELEVVWLDHLPKHVQQKTFPAVRKIVGDPETPASAAPCGVSGKEENDASMGETPKRRWKSRLTRPARE